MVPARITPQMDIKSAGGVNNWTVPGPAEFDFRSDVVTTPTSSMLSAIQRTTLLDDVFAEDPTTTSLESFIADLTGHEAGLLVLSGTMVPSSPLLSVLITTDTFPIRHVFDQSQGNILSHRTHLTSPPHSILTPSTSHILHYEAGGVASLTGALITAVTPSNGHHLTLEDIRAHAVLDDDVHSCPTRVISLENTLGGEILPLSECTRIAAWARAQHPPVLLHCDGARLWEACVAISADAEGNGKSPSQILIAYGECFDSLSLCFSKGLGAPIGSVVVGSRAFVKKARWVRKSIGGGLRQAGVISAAARASVEETFLGGRLGGSHVRAKEIARLWEARGGRLSKKTETNMVWFDLEAAKCEVKR
ncbi:MAG: hypothetical protein LQ347_006077, partial [Umbilicaria vellea]